jgi:mannose/fructose/N-acetylgalactosamine-specific phosphotransferase system component IIB
VPVIGDGLSLRLFRVDDRLLHGQVALGWGRRIGPCIYLLVDDRLAADPDAADLYGQAAPEGCLVRVLSEAELPSLLSAPRGTHQSGTGLTGAQSIGAHPGGTQPAVLLVSGLGQAARLLRAGIPGPVNLGGIHLHAGAREIFPFLFLTREEETLVAALMREGHRLFAQDLPHAPERPPHEWLDPELLAGGPEGA